MSEPQTEAGKAHVGRFRPTNSEGELAYDLIRQDTLAIEAEAVTTFLQSDRAEALLAEVAKSHGFFVGGYSWFCCGPHPGTDEPDDDHAHAQFDFGKKGSQEAVKHLWSAILASLREEMKK